MSPEQALKRIDEINRLLTALDQHLGQPWERLYALFPQNREPAQRRDAAVKRLIAERDALCVELERSIAT